MILAATDVLPEPEGPAIPISIPFFIFGPDNSIAAVSLMQETPVGKKYLRPRQLRGTTSGYHRSEASISLSATFAFNIAILVKLVFNGK
jgi:hypothetical protein